MFTCNWSVFVIQLEKVAAILVPPLVNGSLSRLFKEVKVCILVAPVSQCYEYSDCFDA